MKLHPESTLGELRPGALFITRDGAMAVKSEYTSLAGVCRSVLLESGEYADFPQGNATPVREVEINTDFLRRGPVEL